VVLQVRGDLAWGRGTRHQRAMILLRINITLFTGLHVLKGGLQAGS
jgi:hypothetical protein